MQIEDEFVNAFANAETGDIADQGTAATPDLDAVDPDAVDPAGIVDPDAVDPDAVDPDAVDPDDKAASDALAKDGEDEETYKQRYKSLQGVVKHDKESWDIEKGALLQQVNDANTNALKQAEPEKKVTKAFVDSLTDEQKEQLKEYDKEFEVVAKMEGLKRDTEFAKLRNEMVEWKESLVTRLNEQVAPVIESNESIKEASHFSTLKEAHPDYETYRDDGSLQEWIDSKPSYLRNALQAVYDDGEAEDTIDLIADFKTENDITLETNTTIVPNADELEKKRLQKKNALRTVKTKRGAVNVVKADAEDYDAAFDEASSVITE